MGWYKAPNAHFHRDYYKRRKLGGLLGTTTKSVRSILQFSKYFTGRLGRSQKKGSLMLHTLKKISAARSAAKLLHIFSHRASRGAVWPLHFKFASYAYVVVQLWLFHPKTAPKAISEGLKSNIFLGGHVPQVPHTPSARASLALCDQSRAHWNPPFQNPRSATEGDLGASSSRQFRNFTASQVGSDSGPYTVASLTANSRMMSV